MSHSRFNPSKAHIWGDGCPGYVRMASKLKKSPKTEIAKEGTAAHWVLSKVLNGDPGVSIGGKAANGVTVTKEMFEYAENFRSCTEDISHKVIEQPVNIFDIHPECRGTLDFAGLKGRICYVVDYKFGWVPVEVRKNLQLVCYAWGVLNQMWKCGGFDYFHLGIFQPRAYAGISWWKVSTEDVRKKIYELSKIAQSPTDCTKPGLNRCRYCECKIICPGFQKFGFSVEGIFSSVKQLKEPDINSLAKEYRILESFHGLYEQRLAALKTEITARLKLGEHCEHYVLDRTVGKRYWSIPEKNVRFIGEMNGVDLTNIKTVTPNQAEERGLPKGIVNKCSKRGANVKLEPLAKLQKKAFEVFGNGK